MYLSLTLSQCFASWEFDANRVTVKVKTDCHITEQSRQVSSADFSKSEQLVSAPPHILLSCYAEFVILTILLTTSSK